MKMLYEDDYVQYKKYIFINNTFLFCQYTKIFPPSLPSSWSQQRWEVLPYLLLLSIVKY